MSLDELTDRNAVLAAIREFDRHGRAPFLRRYGFREARAWFIQHKGVLYDSKAVAGVAVGIQLSRPAMKPSEFSGGEATVARHLRALGFDVLERRSGAGSVQGDAATKPLTSSPLWILESDQQRSEQAFEQWRRALVGQAKQLGSRRWRRLDLRLRVTLAANGRTQLAPEDATDGWTVELNAPAVAGSAHRLTAVARDPAGRPWLLRQGRLKLKGRREGTILEEEFQAVTGLEPAPVQAPSGPNNRVWFRVCRLDGPADQIAADTAQFVAYCRLVRDQRGPAALSPGSMAFAREVLAGPEVMGFLRARARPPVPETEIWKAQAEVWQALAQQLKAAGQALLKPRPAPGFEVDGLVRFGAKTVLIEAKTGCSASDVYTGLGQLQLYHKMLELPEDCEQVLLLPQRPSACLEAALKELGVTVSVYSIGEGAPGDRVRFERSLLRSCGVTRVTGRQA